MGYLTLDWKNFENNAQYTFKRMWNNNDLSDVTLVTGDDQQIRAHRIILISSSQFFKSIFQKHPHHNPLLYLKDIDSNFLERILEFIYTGKCDIEQRNVVEFLSAGKNLEVTGLLGDEERNEKYYPIEDNVMDVIDRPRGDCIENNGGSKYRTYKKIKIEKDIRVNIKCVRGIGDSVCSECNAVFKSRSGLWY